MLDMGNPWVFFTLSLPISACTRTHKVWVRICTGLPSGTDKGMVPMGKGTDFLNIIVKLLHVL